MGEGILLTKIEAEAVSVATLGSLDLKVPENLRDLKTLLNINKRVAYAAYCNRIDR